MLNIMRFDFGSVPEIRTLLRHCPGCGRRFEIRLVTKQTVDSAEHTEDKARLSVRPGMIAKGIIARPVTVEESNPVTVDMEEFQYTYRCKHCGHQWVEIHEKTEEASSPTEYSGD